MRHHFCQKPIAMGLRIVASMAIVLLISGCPSDPNADFYTTVEPKPADVAGRYVLTNQSVQSGGLERLPGKASSIELHEDGTFTAVNLPPSGSDADDEQFFNKLVSDSGTWKVTSVGSIANGGQPPKTHWGVGFTCETAEIMPGGLTGSGPPYGLLFTIGDPDRAKSMCFEREKQQEDANESK